jgi:hypothetical protein
MLFLHTSCASRMGRPDRNRGFSFGEASCCFLSMFLAALAILSILYNDSEKTLLFYIIMLNLNKVGSHSAKWRRVNTTDTSSQYGVGISNRMKRGHMKSWSKNFKRLEDTKRQQIPAHARYHPRAWDSLHHRMQWLEVILHTPGNSSSNSRKPRKTFRSIYFQRCPMTSKLRQRQASADPVRWIAQ